MKVNQTNNETKPSLGLDLIDPRSSHKLYSYAHLKLLIHCDKNNL